MKPNFSFRCFNEEFQRVLRCVFSLPARLGVDTYDFHTALSTRTSETKVVQRFRILRMNFSHPCDEKFASMDGAMWQCEVVSISDNFLSPSRRSMTGKEALKNACNPGDSSGDEEGRRNLYSDRRKLEIEIREPGKTGQGQDYRGEGSANDACSTIAERRDYSRGEKA